MGGGGAMKKISRGSGVGILGEFQKLEGGK